MKILVVNGHPDSASFISSLFNDFVSKAKTRTEINQVTALDLGNESFDPVLRFGYRKHMPIDSLIEYSQQQLLQVDRIILFSQYGGRQNLLC